MQESIQVTCPKCKARFRDSARRVQAGYSRQCPSCEVVIFFEDGNPHLHVRKALRDAHDMRKALAREEEERTKARTGGGEYSALRSNRYSKGRLD